VVVGSGLSTAHQLPASGEVVIGRAPECDVSIDDPSLSRRHAILRVGETLTLEDLGSSNGTRLRGKALSAGVPEPVAVGEAMELGTTLVLVQRGASGGSTLRLWPHGYFEGRLEEECLRAGRTEGEFVVLRVRHAPGARGVVDALGALLRPDDVAGFYAPGELEALLFEAAREDAEDLARRLVEAAPDLDVKVGWAAYPEDGVSPYELAAIASARAQGRPERAADAAAVVDAAEGPMQAVLRLAERVALGGISVLILGETGVGKEVMAERIHRKSPRADKPFVRLNCAALSESLLESELFGHEKGSFTGAAATKPGLLETADGGTVLLDEVGELPLAVQVKLLRVLEDRQVLRVGGVKPRAIDVRFIAATNRDLELESARGAFRQDLYFRINGVTIVIPPLRERPAEIERLARQFAQEAAGDLGIPTPTISPEALALLRSYSWPGNIRELRNFIERAVLLCGRGQILPQDLPAEKMAATLGHRVAPGVPSRPLPAPSASGGPAVPAEDAGDRRQKILDALSQSAGNQTEAARLLGVSRRTLSTWLNQYRIARPRKGVPAG